MSETRICQYCKKEFDADLPHQKFCNLKCARSESRGKRELYSIKGKDFLGNEKEVLISAYSSDHAEKTAIKLFKFITEIAVKTEICPICGQEYIVKPSRRNQVYCSPKCAASGRELLKSDHSLKRENRIEDFITNLKSKHIIDVIGGEFCRGKNTAYVTANGAREYEHPDTKYFVVIFSSIYCTQEEKDESVTIVNRLKAFIHMLPNRKVVDVFQGRILHGAKDHRIYMSTKDVEDGAGYKYYVVVIEE